MTTLETCSAAQIEALRTELHRDVPALLGEVSALLEKDWPDYAEFLDRERADVRLATETFVDRLLEVAQGPDRADGRPGTALGADGFSGELFESVGRIQWREGRDLTTLLTAYQMGARATWWHVSSAALKLGLEPGVLAGLAEAVFEFVGELSSASAHGYAQEQAESSQARERLRDDLTELLLSGRATQTAIATAAARAGWQLPREAGVVLVDPDDEVATGVVARASSLCLRVHHGGMLGLIVPDPAGPGHGARLRSALRGTHAVIGHAVPLAQLPASTKVAMVAARLARAGVLTGEPVSVEECLDTIIVHGDESLLAALRTQVLAPLARLTPNARDRLTETLTVWLRHGGDRQAVARDLHVHPQTVKYRLGQLRDVFGSRLDDPVQKARLFLALNWGPPGAG